MQYFSFFFIKITWRKTINSGSYSSSCEIPRGSTAAADGVSSLYTYIIYYMTIAGYYNNVIIYSCCVMGNNGIVFQQEKKILILLRWFHYELLLYFHIFKTRKITILAWHMVVTFFCVYNEWFAAYSTNICGFFLLKKMWLTRVVILIETKNNNFCLIRIWLVNKNKHDLYIKRWVSWLT